MERIRDKSQVLTPLLMEVYEELMRKTYPLDEQGRFILSLGSIFPVWSYAFVSR